MLRKKKCITEKLIEKNKAGEQANKSNVGSDICQTRIKVVRGV